MNFFKKTLLSSALLSIFAMPILTEAVTFYKPYMESQRGSAMSASIPVSFDSTASESMDNMVVEVASKESYSLANIKYNHDVSGIEFRFKEGQNGFPYLLASSKIKMTSSAYRVLVKIHNKITGSVVYQDFNLGAFAKIKKAPNVDVISRNMVKGNRGVAINPNRLSIKRETIKPRVIALRRSVDSAPTYQMKSSVVPSSNKFKINSVSKKDLSSMPKRYKVKRGDTLTGISKKLSSSNKNWNMWSMAGALYELNGDSFVNNNINKLKNRENLNVPDYRAFKNYSKYTRAFTMSKISDDADLFKSHSVSNESTVHSLNDTSINGHKVKPMPTKEFQLKTLESISRVLSLAKMRNDEIVLLRKTIQEQVDKITTLELKTIELEKMMVKYYSLSKNMNNNIDGVGGYSISNPLLQIILLIAINILFVIIIMILIVRGRGNNEPSGPNRYSEPCTVRDSKDIASMKSKNNDMHSGVTSSSKEIYKSESGNNNVNSTGGDQHQNIDKVDGDESYLEDIDDEINDDEEIILLPINIDFDKPLADSLPEDKVEVSGYSLDGINNEVKDDVKITLLDSLPDKDNVDNVPRGGIMKKMGFSLPSSSKGSDGKKISSDMSEIKIRELKAILKRDDINDDDYEIGLNLLKELLAHSPDAFRLLSLKVEFLFKGGAEREYIKLMSNLRGKLSDSKWDIFIAMVPEKVRDKFKEETI